MPNIVDLLNQITNEITRTQNESLWMSKLGLEYSYGQKKESEKNSRQSNFARIGVNMNESSKSVS